MANESPRAQSNITDANRTWTSHWLLICGSLLILGSALLTWMRFPYSRNVAGWELPMQALIPHIHEYSYWLNGIAVLALAFFLRKRFRRSLLVGAAILLTLWLLVPVRQILRQPPLLRRLSEEYQAVPAVKAFTAAHSAQKNSSTEQSSKPLHLVTLTGRLSASLSFLGLGWYCFGLGSVLVAGYAVCRLPGERIKSSVALIALPACVLTALAIPSVIGQHYFNRASVARTAGNNEQAIINYRKAMK